MLFLQYKAIWNWFKKKTRKHFNANNPPPPPQKIMKKKFWVIFNIQLLKYCTIQKSPISLIRKCLAYCVVKLSLWMFDEPFSFTMCLTSLMWWRTTQDRWCSWRRTTTSPPTSSPRYRWHSISRKSQYPHQQA